MALRYSIVTGAVGFLGGILYRDKNPLNKFEIFAANPVQTVVDTYEYTGDEESKDFLRRTMKFGFPGFDTIKRKKSFVLSYDRRNRVPHWVFEHLTADHITPNKNVNRKNCEFLEDDSIHAYFRSTDDDYKDSGFDRGHLAAAGNHRSKQEYQDDTFFLSNIAPQVGLGFNQGRWKHLEEYVEKLVKKNKSVYVCSGPLFLPREEPDGTKYVKYQVIGPNDVAVPTHFFKVILVERKDSKYFMEAYLMPNASIDNTKSLDSFQENKDVIERAAGLLLFENLDNIHLLSINGMPVE
ncbi:unnamed protein product [Larinioides sclopetarius]|uniref:Endonuclease n=1 Tax=Larinioides sclopetarius TaxID=280406 RepID=A0AAV1ZPA7_9ARAC